MKDAAWLRKLEARQQVEVRCARLNAKRQTPNSKGFSRRILSAFGVLSLAFGVWR